MSVPAMPISGSIGKAAWGIISLADAAIMDNCEDWRALGTVVATRGISGRRGDVEGESVTFCGKYGVGGKE